MTTTKQPSTFLERDDWMRAMNASGEPRAARCLAFAIALHLNVKTGRCDPGHKALSKDAGISERSVRRFVALLVTRTGHSVGALLSSGGSGVANVSMRPKA